MSAMGKYWPFETLYNLHAECDMEMAYNSTFSYDSNEIRDVCGSLQQLLV